MIPSGGKAGQSDISTLLYLSKNGEVRSLHDESLRCSRRRARAKGRIEMEKILNNKTAVVYGAGSIGGAVAAAFAKAGATVFVADHHEDALTNWRTNRSRPSAWMSSTRMPWRLLSNLSSNRPAMWTSPFVPPRRTK